MLPLAPKGKGPIKSTLKVSLTSRMFLGLSLPARFGLTEALG